MVAAATAAAVTREEVQAACVSNVVRQAAERSHNLHETQDSQARSMAIQLHAGCHRRLLVEQAYRRTSGVGLVRTVRPGARGRPIPQSQ